MRIRYAHRFTLVLIVGIAVAMGCNRSPEAKKNRYLERGDSYFGQQQYKEAILEYRNVLRLEGTNAHAVQQLGFAYYQIGELGSAFPLLLKTKELTPDSSEARLKLGAMYLAGRKIPEAREEVAFVLEHDPKNFDALLLWAGAASTPQEVDEALARLETVRADFGERAKLHLALGVLHLRKQDLVGAERSFDEAVTKEPQSIEAHTLLGNFYLAKSDTTQAEREFKMAADIAPVGSPARIALADFYLLLRKPEEAKQILAEITKETPDFLPAWQRTAQIALGEQRYDDSMRAVDVILKKNPGDVEAQLLRGRVHLAKRETQEAMAEFHKALKSEPKSASAHYHLALAQIQAGNIQQAKGELKEAATIASDFADATLLLAELNIRTGAFQPAIEDLENLLEKQPKLARAYVLLGTAYLSKKEPVRAAETYRQFSLLAPSDPQGPYFVGIGLRAQGKTAEAKKAFEDALVLAPGFVDPLAQLVSIALAEKASGTALDRVKKQIAMMPESAGLHDLLGRVYLARSEGRLAEAAFLKAIDLNPQLFDAYLALGSLYGRTQRYDEALAKLEQALAVNPKTPSVPMLIGVIHEQRGAIPQAQAAYEKALALNPRLAPAANNLAYIYSEHSGDKEKALALAQTAKEVLPEDPRVSDTLGWILYKRGVYERALQLLTESAEKLSNNPEVQYHLGMAYYKLGNHDAAKQALMQALALNAVFPGAEEAKRILADLSPR